MRNLLCGLPPLYPGCIRPHLGKKVVRQTTYSFLLSFAVEFDTGQAIMMIDRGDISLNINFVLAPVPSTLNKKGLIEIERIQWPCYVEDRSVSPRVMYRSPITVPLEYRQRMLDVEYGAESGSLLLLVPRPESFPLVVDLT